MKIQIEKKSKFRQTKSKTTKKSKQFPEIIFLALISGKPLIFELLLQL